MQEKYQNLVDEITYWNTFFSNNQQDRLYELAFFKIFIKFEQFMINAFIHYATGESSNTGFFPERKLKFQSLSHLEGVFIIESKKYLIEKSESIEKLSNHIFEDNHNPFSKTFLDPQYNDNFNYMRTIRNYIAHGSEESLKRYQRDISSKMWIEPYEYLLKKRKNMSCTNYTLFLQILSTHSDLVYNYNNV